MPIKPKVNDKHVCPPHAATTVDRMSSYTKTIDICQNYKRYFAEQKCGCFTEFAGTVPIEHCWEYLERRIRQMDQNNVHQMRDTIRCVWWQMPIGFCVRTHSIYGRMMLSICACTWLAYTQLTFGFTNKQKW